MITTEYEKLANLFNVNERPTLLSLKATQHSALISMHVPIELSWFEGHFPSQKVLPGVVQIDWAGKLGKTLFVDSGVFVQLSNIKFNNMVLPDTTLNLQLTYEVEKGRLKFHFFNESGTFSTGSFTFSPC